MDRHPLSRVRRAALALALGVAAAPALAQVSVADPWVRGIVAGQRATGAFIFGVIGLFTFLGVVTPGMALQQPLKDGDSVPITLTFEGRDGKRQTVEVKAPVRPLTAGPPAHKGHN